MRTVIVLILDPNPWPLESAHVHPCRPCEVPDDLCELLQVVREIVAGFQGLVELGYLILFVFLLLGFLLSFSLFVQDEQTVFLL